MADIRKLLNQIAAQEEQLYSSEFLAPCVSRGKVRARVAGIVCTFSPQPDNFAGWGIFQAVDNKTANLLEEATLPQVGEYLKLLKPMRLRLAYVCKGSKSQTTPTQTWLAYPINEASMQQHVGVVKPVLVHLVTEGTTFEQIVARWDGTAWWFDELDRRADPLIAEQLKQNLKQLTPPQEVRFKGITPEMRTVYELVVQQTKEYQQKFQQHSDEKRLQKALKVGGGNLQEFRDRGEYWQIEWTTADGLRHTSAISKNDLTVMSAGICLSGKDRDFDLQSLVGVVEASDNWD